MSGRVESLRADRDRRAVVGELEVRLPSDEPRDEDLVAPRRPSRPRRPRARSGWPGSSSRRPRADPRRPWPGSLFSEHVPRSRRSRAARRSCSRRCSRIPLPMLPTTSSESRRHAGAGVGLDALGGEHHLVGAQAARCRCVLSRTRRPTARASFAPVKAMSGSIAVAGGVDVQARVGRAGTDARDADLLPAEAADRRDVAAVVARRPA